MRLKLTPTLHSDRKRSFDRHSDPDSQYRSPGTVPAALLIAAVFSALLRPLTATSPGTPWVA